MTTSRPPIPLVAGRFEDQLALVGYGEDVGRTRMWRLRHLVTRFVNPVTLLFAGRIPGFGIVTHTGRSTGRTYHTPVNVFRRDGRFVFFLTYGSQAQWVQNVLAAGGCWIRVRGRDVRLVDPELVVDPARRLVPAPVRLIGRLARVTEVFVMRPVELAG